MLTGSSSKQALATIHHKKSFKQIYETVLLAKISREEFRKLLTRAEEYSNTDFLSWIKESSLRTKFKNTIFCIFALIITIQLPCQPLP